jgi:3-hydroxymyristoyl/3-hydroxydecanoyl-(acyl carrier protein) dehydratase
MRFLFVDKIENYTDRAIRGSKFFGSDHAMRYQTGPQTGEIAPGVISESIGQLVSWLAISRNNFSARPVFLFADRIEVLGAARAGSRIDIAAEIHEMDDKTIVFGGRAYADGELIHVVHSSSGYFMPLADLEDPLTSRQRFGQMCGDGLQLDGEAGAFDFTSLVDQVVSCDGQSIVCSKTMDPAEPFYADHFPRFPVTPIVMINEMIGEATRRLLSTQQLSSGQRIREVSDVKIKNFVRPGERVHIDVKLLESSRIGGVLCVQTVAELLKDGKRILRGRYHYEIGG